MCRGSAFLIWYLLPMLSKSLKDNMNTNVKGKLDVKLYVFMRFCKDDFSPG
jgi:hypothetical protein